MKNETPIGQGHGMQGRFGGLPDPYGSESFSRIVILPLPFDKTSTYQKGSDKGPAALIEASRNMELYDIETESEVYLQGIYTADAIESDSSEEMLRLTFEKTKEYLHKNKFVVVIGGEHSISYAPIKATAEHYGKLTVIQFDAHADLQHSYENNPWSHASVMARVKEIPEVTQTIAIGIRSLAKEELPLLNRSHTFFAHELLHRKNELYTLIKNIEGPIYITFDLDVFDCSLMPSTGTPEPGGPDWDFLMEILQYIFIEKNVVSFDVVELLPEEHNHAPDYVAAKLIYKLLSYKYSKNRDGKNEHS